MSDREGENVRSPLIVNECLTCVEGSGTSSGTANVGNGTSHIPEENREHENATSNFETLIHLVKANMGTGMLGLPVAVMNAGVVVGPICLVLLAVVAIHCMHLLVHIAHFWCRMKRKTRMSYADVAEEVFEARYPGKGWIGRFIRADYMDSFQPGLHVSPVDRASREHSARADLKFQLKSRNGAILLYSTAKNLFVFIALV